MSNRVGLADFEFPLLAGVPKRVDIDGDWIEFVTGSAAITVRNESGAEAMRAAPAGVPIKYRTLVITSAVDQTVRVGLGYVQTVPPYQGGLGVPSGAALVANVNIGDAISDTADVSIPAGTTVQVLPANPARIRANISLSATATLGADYRIGGSSITAGKGQTIEPGDKASIDNRAAIYIYNGSAGAVTAARSEEL